MRLKEQHIFNLTLYLNIACAGHLYDLYAACRLFIIMSLTFSGFEKTGMQQEILYKSST